jgi:hypothetical protein
MNTPRELLLENWLRSEAIPSEFIALSLNWRAELLARSHTDPDDQTILAYARALAHKNIERYRDATIPPLSTLHVNHEFLCTLKLPWWKMLCVAFFSSVLAVLFLTGILLAIALNKEALFHVWR